MTGRVPLADDAAAIAERLREIQAERAAAIAGCAPEAATQIEMAIEAMRRAAARVNRVPVAVEPAKRVAPRQTSLRLSDDVWVTAKDGDDTGRAIFREHYSYKPYRDGRDPMLFVGPGEKLVLLTSCARGLFVWRRFFSDDGQQGINCAVFRNEGAGLSSALIRAADDIADQRWPGERHYTYVNPRKIRSSNPGYCFLAAGWQRCGITKWNRLVILERNRLLSAQEHIERAIAQKLARHRVLS